jgi:3'(2'), 5'-bisphosphate nucleotidase
MEFMTEDVCRIAAEAGAVILRHYKRTIEVSAKADASPLTEADRASHECIVGALERLTPDWKVISEESPAAIQSEAARGLPYWLVDPLDGTKEFLKGTNEFTVNIALLEAGRPVLGVVFAPALGLMYHASREAGAWRKRGEEAAVLIRTRVADPARLAVVASKDHAGPQVAGMLARAPGAEVKSMGSSLKFCLVAEGSADLYLRDLPTMEWDTAAAQCVVECAGGVLSDLAGKPLSYGKPELRNPALMTVGDPSFQWKSLLDSRGGEPFR